MEREWISDSHIILPTRAQDIYFTLSLSSISLTGSINLINIGGKFSE